MFVNPLIKSLYKEAKEKNKKFHCERKIKEKEQRKDAKAMITELTYAIDNYIRKNNLDIKCLHKEAHETDIVLEQIGHRCDNCNNKQTITTSMRFIAKDENTHKKLINLYHETRKGAFASFSILYKLIFYLFGKPEITFVPFIDDDNAHVILIHFYA